MDRYIFWIVMAVAFGLQLVLCLKVKRVVFKLIPLLALLLLMILCVICYALSGWTNWAFLILLLFLSMPIGAIAAGWLGYGILKVIKTLLLSRKNT